MKKLIFVLILLFSIDITHRLLLLLPFTWFKSEVKDTVVEPVVPVEKRQIGVLFYRKVNGNGDGMSMVMRMDGRIVKNMVKEHRLMEKGSGKETSI